MLGLVDFDSALFLQERLVYEISGRNDRQGGLLVCEHPPLVTVGREGSHSHFLVEPRELVARQMPVRWLSRGGGCVVHAPGQLAVYPIVPLQRLGLGLAEYRRRLESAVVDACAESRIPTFRREDRPGVFCRLGKFAETGVAVKSATAWQGLFVNVQPAMDLVRLVRTSSGGRLTSLATQQTRVLSMHAMREALVRRLAERLGYRRVHLYTGHPLLGRTRQTVYAGVS